MQKELIIQVLASKETGPFIATNGFIFVFDGGEKRMRLSVLKQQKMQRVTEQNSADMSHRDVIWHIHNAQGNAGECMIKAPLPSSLLLQLNV